MRVEGIEPICLGHRTRTDLPRTIWRLARCLRSMNIDIVHTMLPTAQLVGSIAGALTRKPVVATLVSTAPPAPPRVNSRIAVEVRSALTSLLRVRTCAVSEAVAEAARARGISVDSVTYPGIPDVPQLASAPTRALRSNLGVRGEGPLLLSVGRLERAKGHASVVRAMPEVLRELPHARLVVAGDGTEKGSLQTLIGELDLGASVALLGVRTDVIDLLHASDIYVSGSTAEGFVGYATLEAALTRTPIVATRIAAVAELLKNEVHALLVDPGRSDAIADAILTLARTPVLAADLATAARATVRMNCSLDSAARQLRDFYGTVSAG